MGNEPMLATSLGALAEYAIYDGLVQDALPMLKESTRIYRDLGDLSATRGPEFKKLIECDNRQLQEDLLPAYRQMTTLFRERFWLADPDTRRHYQDLIQFVELWDRWLAKSIPAEVIERVGHAEERLHPFYEHIYERHDSLRTRLESGRP